MRTGHRKGQRGFVDGNPTPRELEVVTLIAYGHTNNEIARQLGISLRTAEMHRANAMRKIGATSRADVTAWALRNELLH
jgi:two-component system response regulator NreC